MQFYRYWNTKTADKKKETSENQTREKLTSDFKDCLISNVNIFVF